MVDLDSILAHTGSETEKLMIVEKSHCDERGPMRSKTKKQQNSKLFKITERNMRELIKRGWTEIEIDPAFLSGLLPIILCGILWLFSRSMQFLRKLFIPEMSQQERQKTPDYGIKLERGQPIENPTAIQKKEGRIFEDRNKDWLHHHPHIRFWLMGKGVLVRGMLKKLFDALDIIYHMAEIIHLEICRRLDLHLPGHQFLARAKASVYQNVTRVLCYRETEEGDRIEKVYPHTDRTFLSIHWYGSFQNLVLWMLGKRLRTNETKVNKILVFFGQLAPQICKRLKPVVHAPIDRRASRSRRRKGAERRMAQVMRLVIVSFMKALTGPIPSDLYEPHAQGR